MAYFLKKTTNKKGTYLQIYESHWDRERRQTVHKSVRPVGYAEELAGSEGLDDPIAHYREVVREMNEERARRMEEERAKGRPEPERIGSVTPQMHLGHFPLMAVKESLGVSADLALLQMKSGFRFSLDDLLSSLAYARAVSPCSKSRTFHDVLPQMLGVDANFSLDQLYDGLAFLGEEYEKVIECYNAHVREAFGRDTSKAFFDCTNFYFEIDREDDLRRKGPSKEGRADPIVGMGLLLDADCIPIGMTVFPGNESEKPQLRSIVSDLRRRNSVTGRTIVVADKGLNCADNIASALLAGDGYVFSKSVKTLARQEREWALADGDDWREVRGRRGELLYKYKETVGDFRYGVTGADGRAKAVELREKRVVTYNPDLARKQLAEISRQVEKARRACGSQAKRQRFGDKAKYLRLTAVSKEGEVGDDAVVATLDHEAIRKAKAEAGYNMLVTSEVGMDPTQLYDTYHRLWRIEETFRVMKTELDARPVYLQRQSTITGHFLVCYTTVLLLRLLQLKVLGDEFGSHEIMDFVRGFDVVRQQGRGYVNVSRRSDLTDLLEERTGLPLGNLYLGKGDVDAMVRCKLSQIAGRTREDPPSKTL